MLNYRGNITIRDDGYSEEKFIDFPEPVIKICGGERLTVKTSNGVFSID